MLKSMLLEKHAGVRPELTLIGLKQAQTNIHSGLNWSFQQDRWRRVHITATSQDNNAVGWVTSTDHQTRSDT